MRPVSSTIPRFSWLWLATSPNVEMYSHRLQEPVVADVLDRDVQARGRFHFLEARRARPRSRTLASR